MNNFKGIYDEEFKKFKLIPIHFFNYKKVPYDNFKKFEVSKFHQTKGYQITPFFKVISKII